MHVIVVGGGVGGLTTALALARRRIAVTVLEQAHAFGDVGAGVQLSPNATRLLFALGLESGLRAVAFASPAVEVREHRSGRLLLRTELGAAAEGRWGAPYLQVHRADLHGLLAQAFAEQACVEIRMNAKLTAISQTPHEARAHLAMSGGEERTLTADALIGCDGVRSTVRGALWGERPARFTGQVAWRGLATGAQLSGGPSRLSSVVPVTTVWTGRGRHFVHYPVRGGDLVNLVGVVEQRTAPTESWTEPGDPAAFGADFIGWPAPVEELIAGVGSPWRYAIHDRPPLARWSEGRVTLLGDAAHPAPPFLAQGAAMAVEDAEALARHLAHHVEARTPAADAFRDYEAERRPRTMRVQRWSRRNARLFHLPGSLARTVFGAAGVVDRLTPGGASARIDWLYGYRPPGRLV